VIQLEQQSNIQHPTSKILHFAISALQPQLDVLRAEIPGVRAAEDIECLHRMRVASRRIRTRLRLFADILPKKRLFTWQQAMRRITPALGAARDLDVQLAFLQDFLVTVSDSYARTGIAAVLHGLQLHRVARQQEVETALTHLEESGILSDLHDFLQHNAADDATHVATAAERVLQPLIVKTVTAQLSELIRHEVYLAFPERATEHHAMRIAAKHVRYTLETFTPLFGDWIKPTLKMMRTLQDTLGDIHDSDVWDNLLSAHALLELIQCDTVAFPQEVLPGITLLQHNRRTFREKRFAELVEQWQQLQRTGYWYTLLCELQHRNDEGGS